MDPNSGRLYPTVEDALKAGVPHPVEMVGREEDVQNISAAVAAVRADATHPCPKKGCGLRVNRNLLACAKHWALVPLPLQREVYSAYRHRSSDLLRHVRAVQAAVEAINS